MATQTTAKTTAKPAQQAAQPQPSQRNELVVAINNFQKMLAEVPIQKKLAVLTAGTGITVARLCRIAVEACERNPDLLRANRDSLMFAVYDCAKTGLSPDPLSGEAALVPFKGRVQMLPMYKGLLKHVYQAGKVREVTAEVVRDGDLFDYSRGTSEDDNYLQHKPSTKARGKITHVYTLVTWKDDGPLSFEVMDVEDVEAIRRRSAMPNSPAWVNDWGMMAKKTVIKRQIKYFEKNVAPMAKALADMDDRHDATGEVIHFGDTDGSIIIENEGAQDDGHKTPAGAPADNKSTRLDQVATGGGASKAAGKAQAEQPKPEPKPSETKVIDQDGEVHDFGPIPMPKDGRRPDLDAWVKLLYAKISVTPDVATLAKLGATNAATIDTFKEIDPETHADIGNKFQARADELGKDVV